MNYILSIVSLLLYSSVLGQFFINGAAVHSLPQSIIYVNTDSLLIASNGYFLHEGYLLVDKDVINNSGHLENDGEIEIEQNFINNDFTEGVSSSSIIRLKGNWTNNDTHTPGESTVFLAGNQQIIDGSQNTTFYNLTAQGFLADIKRLVGVDVEVLNELNLGNVEFATDENILTVSNPLTNAIIRNNGFVSSLDAGRLERATNSTNSYLFPTGSTLGTTRYRPVEITPNLNGPSVYGVRLANLEASLEGFDVQSFSDSLCAVNPYFYHRIYGNQVAGISMFYIENLDGKWDAMANWRNAGIWEKMRNENESLSGTFNVVTIPSWNDFSTFSYALGLKKPELQLPIELTINQGQSITLNPNYSGPTPQSVSWTPTDNITCASCIQTIVSPNETTTYKLEIDVNEFCKLSESVRIAILNKIFIPDAFTPNGDGINDVFRVVNAEDFEEIEMNVYNRWGELIHKGTGRNHGWNGIYKEREQPIDVYVFFIRAKTTSDAPEIVLSGNVTLVR
jgi:gliding motility-associated-like protein